MKLCSALLLFLPLSFLKAQKTLAPLTVEKIMRDQRWIGTSPSNPYWSADGQMLFFSWNPDKSVADSLYYITLTDRTPKKASAAMQQTAPGAGIVYNTAKTAYAYAKDGDLFYVDVQKRLRRLTQTAEAESGPQFIEKDAKLAFTRAQNLYAIDLATGLTAQLTNFVRGAAPKEAQPGTQDAWLQADAISLSRVLQERKAKRDSAEAINKRTRPKELRSIYTDDKIVLGTVVSPDARFVAYRLVRQATGAKTTIIPSYVTESGYTTDISGRTNVGAPQTAAEFYIFDREKDTVIAIKPTGLPGLTDPTDYAKDYLAKDTAKRKPVNRTVTFRGPVWSEDGSKAVVEARSADNKDRWLLLLDAATGNLKPIDRQRDEAWIAGPGTFSMPVWLDANTILFQSEASGYSHIYKADVNTGVKVQLTNGKHEISNVQLSRDKQRIFYTANDLHPGDYQVYLVTTQTRPAMRRRLTKLTGINRYVLSPDERTLAVLHSYSNKPWELYLVAIEGKEGYETQQITNLAQSDEFKSYAWRDPQIVTFTARDGATVYARLYKPTTQASTKPAVIFVHGAGYLQNVHKGWSTYSREYMFHNLLADGGYTVLDIDYRGSEGYGRDWRTGIYRYMGGKDLSDHIDGAAYLVKQHGVDPKRIGIYGGSYGGFITLMAMFTQPDVFAAGAALRSVTDWAHYNHGYTSNILNEPFTDSIAYKKSSPIYYAEGLKGHLLMCHGMVDVNVHFQDIVRLTQRLIELGKENWELAVYPVEDHGFVEPSSWTDEYKRILKLFERVLK